MTDSNYGLLLQIGDGATPTEAFTTIGEVLELGIPEILTDSIDKTNHSSAGWKEKIPSGLKELSEFDCTLDFDQSVFATIYALMLAKTIGNYRIVWADTLIQVWQFSAFPLSIKQEKASAESPDQLKFTVTFCPTGAPSFVASSSTGHWYDGILALSIQGGDFTTGSGLTKQLVVYGVIEGSVPVLAPMADLTFTTSSSYVGAVSAAGVVTAGSVAGLTAQIVAALTADTDIKASATLTVVA